MPPVIDPNMFKAVTRKERRCVQAPDAMMTNKDEFPVFRRFGDHFLHQFLSEKCGTFDVNGIPFFPTANIDQWKLFTRLQPFRDLSRAKFASFDPLSCPARIVRDDLLDRKIVVSRTNRRSKFRSD